jgi:hypothetical protein
MDQIPNGPQTRTNPEIMWSAVSAWEAPSVAKLWIQEKGIVKICIFYAQFVKTPRIRKFPKLLAGHCRSLDFGNGVCKTPHIRRAANLNVQSEAKLCYGYGMKGLIVYIQFTCKFRAWVWFLPYNWQKGVKIVPYCEIFKLNPMITKQSLLQSLKIILSLIS